MAAQQQVLDYVNDSSANSLPYCKFYFRLPDTDNNLIIEAAAVAAVAVISLSAIKFYTPSCYSMFKVGGTINYIIYTRQRICSFLSD